MAQQQQTWDTLWWPAHRPLQSNELVGFDAQGQPQLQWTTWSRGIQQTNAGDLKMVSDWWRLGFIIRNPHLPPSSNVMATPSTSLPDDRYYSVERSGPDTEKSD
jgi:hypothetical protein